MSRQRRERQQAHAQKYLADVIARAQAATLHRGRAYTIEVRHDDWCPLLAGTGPCACSPDVSAPKLVPAPEDN